MTGAETEVSLLERLKRRKLVQWALAYIAGAWVVVQVVGELAESWAWPGGVVRGLHVLLLVGFVGALVLAWYHGEQGRQRVSGAELLILAVLLAIAGAGLALLRGGGASGVVGEASADAEAREAGPEGADRGVATLVGSAPPRSVAVLPLENRSPDPGDAYLAGAFPDQLTTSLGRAGLHVPSRTSAMRFADTALDARSIATALGVGHLLEGSVQRGGDRIRVSLSLIDTNEDQPAWQEEYERPFADILDLQSEIAGQVARELQSTFSEAERERTYAGTDDPMAWDLVQRAMQQPPAAWLPLLRQAVALDSTFATAWMMISSHYSITGDGPHWRDSARVAHERALRHAEHPTLRLALRGPRQFADRGTDDEWLAEVRRTVQEFPNDALLVSVLASAHEQRGELAEGVRWMRRLVVLDPMNPGSWYYLGRLYRLLEMGEEAESALRRALEVAGTEATSELRELYRNQGRYEEALAQEEKLGASRLARGLLLNWSGDVEEAHEIFEKVFAELDFTRTYRWAPEIIYARQVVGDTAGNGDLMARAERRLLERIDVDSDLRRSLVQLAALRRDIPQATELLEESVDEGYRDAWTLRRDPILAEARTDSAFAATLDGLTELVREAREAVRRMPDEIERL
ncbi:MAG: hypothetical protein ACODAA_04395 [Gemmatimonadota bacterium]